MSKCHRVRAVNRSTLEPLNRFCPDTALNELFVYSEWRRYLNVHISRATCNEQVPWGESGEPFNP